MKENKKIRKLFWLFALILSIGLLRLTQCVVPAEVEQTDLTQYVDPFIGTGFHGHTFPGPAMPFGQIQLSPDNGTQGWDWCSGYHYSDSLIVGFSHTHLSGTGIGDLADLSMMPTTKQIDDNFFSDSTSVSANLQSRFSHDKEEAKAGYYRVKLLDDDIDVELSTTKRLGFQKYSFAKGKNNQVVYDLGFAINWDRPVDCFIEAVSDTEIAGYRHSKGWAKNQKLFFVSKFSNPFQDIHFYLEEENLGKSASGKQTKAVLNFGDVETLIVKTAISSVSIESARMNLETDDNGFDFEQVVEKAISGWNQELAKIEVDSDNEELKKTFYTALYHAFLAPYTFSDVDGRFKDYKDEISKAEGYTKYTVLSLWDTFRALKPLFSITQTDILNDIIKSMLVQYEQTGLLPVWELMGNETGTMIGYHSIPVITDAILKGIGDFDVEKAYEAMKASSMSDIEGLDLFREYGYIPKDLENESVSKALEYCYDDWCIAQVAKWLDKEEDYAYYMKRSKYYMNMFDGEMGFMRPKMSDGSWMEPFDPRYSKHSTGDYTEGNAWQWTWFVPHDVEGLAQAFGSQDAFVKQLDALFTESVEITGEHASPDISGLIGQYAHGNEPSHSTVFLYEMLGKDSWKTQKLVDEILKTLYSTQPDGISGNEDCGQMSAWYVFAAAGIYPACPGDNRYYFARPMFDRLTFKLDGGKKFIISCINQAEQNMYIKTAKLNGELLDRDYITHKELTDGGELLFEMTDTPK